MRHIFRHPAPRSAETTIPCSRCGRPLIAQRTCHKAYLRCESCARDYPLQEYISRMDDALENFLEAINCDRV